MLSQRYGSLYEMKDICGPNGMRDVARQSNKVELISNSSRPASKHVHKLHLFGVVCSMAWHV